MSKRASKGQLVPPRKGATEEQGVREKWLAAAERSFVSPSPANKLYYGVLLRALWPAEHGIPGPHLTQDQIRQSVDQFRASRNEGPYKDVFRRMRELQGEEGFTCIVKEGVSYQLQHLEVGSKRVPRSQLATKEWKNLRREFGFKCSSCGRQEPEAKLSPDHRIPRARGGTEDLGNWQPLCEQCNNIKSSMCRGCSQNCRVCPWAFPEEYRPMKIDDEYSELVRRAAQKEKVTASEFINRILRAHFTEG